MESCLLCLQTPRVFDGQCHSYVPINSHLWLHFDVFGIIEKLFWPIDNMENYKGICFTCWSKLNDIHTFYQQVKEAHETLKTEKLKNKFAYKSCIILPDTTITGEKFVHIKIEDSLEGEDESRFCYEPQIRTNFANIMEEDSTVTVEKRKRGRPRKYNNTQIMLAKAPKRKRGRPRKLNLENSDFAKMNSEQKDPCDPYPLSVAKNTTLPNLLNSSPLSTFVTTIKRSRGRPRKTQNDDSRVLLTSHEVSQKEYNIAQGEISKNIISSTINEDMHIVKRGQTNLNQMKKRKSVKHKALMRNYIATSVRCMQFLKK